MLPPAPNCTPSCLVSISAKKSSEGTSISFSITDSGGDATDASSCVPPGAGNVRLSGRARMPAPCIVSTSSLAANAPGLSFLNVDPWS